MTGYRMTEGKVSPYKKRGRLVWRGTVTVYVADGGTEERKAKAKIFDIECAEYVDRKGEVNFRNRRRAEEAFREWREGLAEQYEAELRKSMPVGEGLAYDGMTVPAYLEMYFDELLADGKEPSTVDGYRVSTAKIRRFLVDRRMGELTREDLEAYNRYAIGLGSSSTTRQKSLRVLKQAIKAHRRSISCDPFEGFRMPPAGSGNPNPLDQASFDRLKADLETCEPDEFMTAVGIAFRTGMREGEIAGLRWKSVDIDAGTIVVENTIARLRGGGRCYEKGPKSNDNRGESAVRVINASTKVRALLRRRFDRMVSEYMREHPQTSRDDAEAFVRGSCYVVGPTSPNHEGEWFTNPTTLGRVWRGYSRMMRGVNGKQPRFHDLRHTYASYALAEGVPVKYAAHNLGHTDVGLTLRLYTGILPQYAKQEAERLDDVF